MVHFSINYLFQNKHYLCTKKCLRPRFTTPEVLLGRPRAGTLSRAAARDVCSARMAPLTMFQKACTAVATAGGAGGAVFAYAVKRVTEDAEFRAWLREASPMASEQVNEFMAEYMPQTVTAIRVEEDMGEPEPSALDGGGVALRRSSRLDSPLDVGINLGCPPPLPRVSDAAKAIFGQLEPKLEPTEAEAATAAAAEGAVPTGASTAKAAAVATMRRVRAPLSTRRLHARPLPR